MEPRLGAAQRQQSPRGVCSPGNPGGLPVSASARREIPQIDQIHFGIMVTVNREIGMITPPVGLNLYVASGISRLGMTETTVACFPWLLTMLVFLMIITYWPALTLWLPRTMGML